ncbi:hypothetical protein NMY22_g15691 [Coprinellus aureogranulatus]|nr:hypothetical protein NMY22_g15691 [Coprinellus aureogranulatus]
MDLPNARIFKVPMCTTSTASTDHKADYNQSKDQHDRSIHSIRGPERKLRGEVVSEVDVHKHYADWLPERISKEPLFQHVGVPGVPPRSHSISLHQVLMLHASSLELAVMSRPSPGSCWRVYQSLFTKLLNYRSPIALEDRCHFPPRQLMIPDFASSSSAPQKMPVFSGSQEQQSKDGCR